MSITRLDDHSQYTQLENPTGPVGNKQINDAGLISFEDIRGAGFFVAPQDYTLPPIASDSASLQAALDTLQGKSHAMLSALTMAAGLFANMAPNAAQLFTMADLNEFVGQILSASTSGKGRSAFISICGKIDAFIDAVRLEAGVDKAVLKVLDDAAMIIDLMKDPYADQEKIQRAIASLVSNGCLFTDGANMDKAQAMSLIFGTLLDSIQTGMKMNGELERLLAEFFHSQNNKQLFVGPADHQALRFSSIVIASAMLGLMALMAAQVEQERDVREETSRTEEAALKVLDRQRMRQEQGARQRIEQDMAEREVLTAQNVATASSSVVSAFSQEMADSWRLLNDLMLKGAKSNITTTSI